MIPTRLKPSLKASQKRSPLVCLFVVVLLVSCNPGNHTVIEGSGVTVEEEVATLQSKDRSTRFSAGQVLDEQEQRLNDQLVALRRQMKSAYDSEAFFPPSQPFVKYKAHVEQTPLFQLLRTMPKGGIHHLHPQAGPDFEWLVQELLQEPKCYVYIGESNEQYTTWQVQLFGQKSVPKGFVSASEAAQQTPDFAKQLLDALIFEEEPLQDSLDIWIDFEKVFARLGDPFDYLPLFEKYMENLIEMQLQDSVTHIEYRLFISKKYGFDAAGQKVFYHPDSTLQVLERLQTKVREKVPVFTHKIIYTSLRFFSEEIIADRFAKAHHYRSRFPEWVKGFDLVAEEDNGHATRYFQDVWEMSDSLEAVYGVDMPFYFHDGESNSPSIDNLYDAVALGSKRIGHGFNLMNFPSLVDAVKAKDICIEVNPISNQLLGYVKDLRLHPAALMIRHGVQISISSDDPSIFNYRGLSYDYWYAIMAWELDLKDVKQLVFNSITYSSLDEAEKAAAMKQLQQSWAHFVTNAITFLDSM